MAQPEVVAGGEAMMVCNIPGTVKHRIGIDDIDQYETWQFCDVVSQVGVKRFSVHARKAWLKDCRQKKIEMFRHCAIQRHRLNKASAAGY